MTINRVTSTDFQNRAGQYLDESGKGPVFITRYDRPVRVLLDIDEYERLSRIDFELKRGGDIDKIMSETVSEHRDLLKQLSDR